MPKLLIAVSTELNKALRRACGDQPIAPYIEAILARSAPIRRAAKELEITFPSREKDGRGKYPRKSKD